MPVGVHYIFLHKICSLMEWLNRSAAECMVSFHDAFLQKKSTSKELHLFQLSTLTCPGCTCSLILN